MKKEIDFTVKGTKLPIIPRGTKQGCASWAVNKFDAFNSNKGDYISFGCTDRHGERFILVENQYYQQQNFWEVSLKEIKKLAQEQNMTETRTIVGYKAPYDILTLKIVKGDILTSPLKNQVYFTEGCKERLPKEIVETWEAVYEEDLKQTLLLGSSSGGQIKVVISKDGIFADDKWVKVDHLTKLIQPTTLGRFYKKDLGTFDNPHNVELLDATFKIGCSIFTLAELKLIAETYYKIKHGK